MTQFTHTLAQFHTHFDIDYTLSHSSHTHCHTLLQAMTHFDIVHTHFGTVNSYDTGHTHFTTVHTLFTSCDIVHTHFDTVSLTLWRSSHMVHKL